MNNTIENNYDDLVESKIIKIRNQDVIVDCDVAELYGVKTRDINQAVKNNPDKFPMGYVIPLNNNEKSEVVEIFHHLALLKYSPVLPNAFTEKGLYMLATILKSEVATQTTLSIIETFSKVKEIAKAVNQIPQFPENSPKQQTLMEKTGELISDLFIPKESALAESEASIEFNFALVKFKYNVKKTKK